SFGGPISVLIPRCLCEHVAPAGGPAHTGSRPAARRTSFRGPGGEPRHPPLTRELPGPPRPPARVIEVPRNHPGNRAGCGVATTVGDYRQSDGIEAVRRARANPPDAR